MEDPMIKEELSKYPLPPFLEGRCVPADFCKWLQVKSQTLLRRDRKRKKPYAFTVNQTAYKQKIYSAVLQSGECDPYTGDLLAWELIGTWDTSKHHPEDYKKQFRLMPTVDHTNPDVLEFEICSWMTNECKSYLTPDEFFAFCQKVITHHQQV
jgi:hypothetical protein